MAVYKRGYQRYRGSSTSGWTRFLVLPRFAWGRILRQRTTLSLLNAAMVWPLLCAIFIYITNHADLLKGLAPQFQSFLDNKSQFFLIYLYVQSLFAVFLAALTGPGLIAPDLANNALPLYFSRPLRRSDYAIARLITLFGLLSIVTWIPGLLLFGMQVGMADSGWFAKNWKLGTGIVIGSAVWILLVSLVAMASSAYARLKAVAGGLVLGFFFIMSGIAGMINGIFRVTWANAMSPTWAARRLWQSLLGVTPSANDPGVVACLSVLIVLMLLLALVIERKLRPVEVIS